MAEETGIGTGAAGTGTGGVEPNGTGTQPNNGGADPGKSNGTSGSTNSGDTNPNIERLIQAAVDRATNKLGNENKKLKNQIQQLQTLNMTDAEKHEHEMSEREKALRDGEAELKAEKNKFYAMTAIKKAGLDDGTDTALGLIELVMAEDEKAIDAKVESMKSLVNKLVTAEVNKTFAQNGRQPGT